MEAKIATEIELKLAARMRDLPALARSLEARAGADSDGARVKLVSTYFDTPDRALARRGLTLRVRERDGKFVQTVKSGNGVGGSPLARGEWEDEIAGTTPDPQAPQTGHFLPPETVGGLVPLFRTEVARQTIALAAGSEARIEAAIDRGRIAVPGREGSEAISEVELELKSGTAGALYDVALDLLGVAPVRLEPRSKSECGYRLAAPEAAPVAAAHAAPIALDPTVSGHEALRRIGLACLDQVIRNEPAVRAGLADGVHQMRVGIRRLRAVLAGFGRMLPKAQRRWASAELRWLALILGAARNLDVFEAALIAPARSALGAELLAPLTEAAERQRKSAYRKAARAVRSTHCTASLLRLLRWFETEAWRTDRASQRLDMPIGEIAPRILDRRRRAVKKRGKHFAGQAPAERHKLRIALKKLRYAADALAALYGPAGAGRFTKPLKRVQDDLGDANDVRVGRDLVAALVKANPGDKGLAAAGKSLLAWHGERLAEREGRLRRHLDRVLDSEPFWSR